MRIKNIVSLLCLACCTQVAMAQAPDGQPNGCALIPVFARDVMPLKGRTLLVIVDDSLSAYGKALKEGFANYWNLTQVKYIKSAEVNNYIESDQYALFTFLIYDMAITVSQDSRQTYGAGGSPQGSVADNSIFGKVCKVIAPDSLPVYTNNPKSVKKGGWLKADYYEFQFLLCGNFIGKKAKHTIENLETCDYEEVAVNKDPAKPLKFYQAQMVPYILPYIIRFQYEIRQAFEGKKDEKAEIKRELKFTFRGKERTNKIECDDINGGMEKMSGKNIYIDSSLINNEGIDFLSRYLMVPKTSIIPVTREKIAELFKNADTNAIILDYIHPSRFDGAYVFYTIYGEPMASSMDLGALIKYYKIGKYKSEEIE